MLSDYYFALGRFFVSNNFSYVIILSPLAFRAIRTIGRIPILILTLISPDQTKQMKNDRRDPTKTSWKCTRHHTEPFHYSSNKKVHI